NRTDVNWVLERVAAERNNRVPLPNSADILIRLGREPMTGLLLQPHQDPELLEALPPPANERVKADHAESHQRLVTENTAALTLARQLSAVPDGFRPDHVPTDEAELWVVGVGRAYGLLWRNALLAAGEADAVLAADCLLGIFHASRSCSDERARGPQRARQI